jgi:hypothetical protein
MEFDKWTKQVTNRLNEHADLIKELILISMELLKKLDAIEVEINQSKVQEGK